MSFADDIAKFVAKTQAKADMVVRKVVLDVGTSVVSKSPVGDPDYWLYNRGTKENPDYVNYSAYRDPPPGYTGGRFRANWQLGVGSMPSGEVDSVDKGGGSTIASIGAAIPGDAAGRVFYIANNLAYGPKLEDGWSRQAPAGMVGLTVTEFQSMVREAVAT